MSHSLKRRNVEDIFMYSIFLVVNEPSFELYMLFRLSAIVSYKYLFLSAIKELNSFSRTNKFNVCKTDLIVLAHVS
jgi:hypothetical protein